MLVDSHCHLDYLVSNQYNMNLDAILKQAHQVGVEYFLTVGVTLEKFPQVLAIAKQHINIFATVGVHPSEQVASEPTVDDLVSLAHNPLVVGIGETGLDYSYDSVPKEIQQQRFKTHVQAAKQTNKPLIVHSRAAKTDILAILRTEQADKIGGILHCFTEDLDMAQQAVAMSFYISFSGIITFKNADQLRDVAKKIPLDKILLETDAPYLAPVPHRGLPNQPAYVRIIAEYLAQLKNITYEEVARQTTKNFFHLFKL